MPDTVSFDRIKTALLNATRGQPQSLDKLMIELQDELRQIARQHLSKERPDHTLQATALVNEAYIRLIGQHNIDGVEKNRFLAAAATTMRRILVDHARGKLADKRGGDWHQVTLSGVDPGGDDPALELIALNDGLEKLRALDERVAKVVEFRYFAGFTVEETAGVLEVSPRTVADDWTFARAWLRRELGT
jgi:RNA polymerase sigma-70 factor (ECF subfamily)